MHHASGCYTNKCYQSQWFGFGLIEFWRNRGYWIQVWDPLCRKSSWQCGGQAACPVKYDFTSKESRSGSLVNTLNSRKGFCWGEYIIWVSYLRGQNVGISKYEWWSPTLVKNGLNEEYIIWRIHKLIALRFWVKMWHLARYCNLLLTPLV